MATTRARGFRSAMLAVAGFACAAIAGLASAAEIKIASVAPDGSRWMQQMRAGAEEIATRTSGRVTMKFYPGGVMGNDAQVLRKVRVGQLQGGAFTAGGLAERYGALNLYGIPLLFRSLEEIDAVRKELDGQLVAGLEDAGFVTFGFIEGGFAKLLSNEPIRSIEDMRRRKVWVPEGDSISFMALEAMGLSPVVLPVTDVLTGLQTGLIDIAFASPVAALVLQWHTKVKYMTDLPISYSMGIFAIDKRAFDGLSAEDRAVVRDVMGRYIASLDREARDDDTRAAEVLAKAGVETIAVDGADVEGWRRTIETIHPRMRERPDIDAAMLERMMQVLAEYRRAHPEAAP
jgi:TRAP-type C4-dicarboxylate transport system substrate-binding protein